MAVLAKEEGVPPPWMLDSVADGTSLCSSRARPLAEQDWSGILTALSRCR